MNPFTILINYFIANSRASFYNVEGNQEITNMAFVASAVSENPLINYLLIENKAKAEGERLTTTAIDPAKSTEGTATNGSASESDPKGAGTGTSQQQNTSTEVLTIEKVKSEIATGNANLKTEITASFEKNNAILSKSIEDKFNLRIASLEGTIGTLTQSVSKLSAQFEQISKGRETGAIEPAKDVVSEKTISKINKK